MLSWCEQSRAAGKDRTWPATGVRAMQKAAGDLFSAAHDHGFQFLGRGGTLAAAGTAGYVGAVVRPVQDDCAGYRATGGREPGASAGGEIERRRESGDGGTLQCPQHSRSSGV